MSEARSVPIFFTDAGREGHLYDHRKTTGSASFAFCVECWERVQASLTGDLDSAVEKRMRLFGDKA